MTEKANGSAVKWELVKDHEGWSMQPAISWLVTAGPQVAGLGELAEGVAHALRAGGLPLIRLRLSTFTLHPLVRAWSGEWDQTTGPDQVDFPFTAQQGPNFKGSPFQTILETGKPVRRRLDGPLADDDNIVYREMKEEGVTDYYAIPMPLGKPSAIGSFGIDRPGGYTDLDIAKLETLASFLVPAIDMVNRRRIATTLLDTYISHRAGGRVLAGHIRRGDCEKIRAAFWYSDLRDFTHLNEALAPEQMIDTLNSYFGVVGDAIMARGGEVLQFIGDAVLAIFECEANEEDTRRACRVAFDAARESLAKIAEGNQTRSEAMLPPIKFGIGLHVGDVTFGNVGADARLGFNVVGPAVNLTARLQNLSKEALVPLLMSVTFAAFLDRPIWPVGTYALRGVREKQQVFTAAEMVEGAVMSG